MGGSRGSGVLSSAGDVLEMWHVYVFASGGGGRWCCEVLGVSGWHDWVWALSIRGEHGESGICASVLVAVVRVVLLESGWAAWARVLGWGGVIYVCVVSLDSLCWWQVQVYVYCARRIPVHLRCTQCSILLHLIDICFLTFVCDGYR